MCLFDMNQETTTKPQPVIWPASPIKDAAPAARKVINDMFPDAASENRSAYGGKFSVIRKDRERPGNEEIFSHSRLPR